MKRTDLGRGAIVYHVIFPHWGKGQVIEIRQTLMGYKTAEKYLVLWNYIFGNGKQTKWCRIAELRKTFNQKKADLIAFFRSQRQSSQVAGEAIDAPDFGQSL